MLVRLLAVLNRSFDSGPFGASVRLGTIAAVVGAGITFMNQARCDDGDRPIVRIATYNVSLYGKQAGEIKHRLASGHSHQAMKIARVVQSVRPDILLVNEIDYDESGETAALLAEKYFATAMNGSTPIEYPFIYAIESNTGVDSSLDLNSNSQFGEPNDRWGYGIYPGQYAMAVFSRFPIAEEQIRTFRKFKWCDLPGAIRPVDPDTGEPYYRDPVWQRLRLSSKNHADVPIRVGDSLIHVLASHPTPPVFDGPADHNGCRNHDEIAFWKHYIGSDTNGLVDDNGEAGGIAADASFVIMGDLNSDPNAGDSNRQAIVDLLADQRIQDPRPTSPGAAQSGRGDETAAFGRDRQLRVDFVVPSADLNVRRSGVFWPQKENPKREWISASDHRLVWIEVQLP